MNRFTVDVDPPSFKPGLGPISSRLRIDHLYAFRPSDAESFRAEAAQKLGLGAQSTLLDLCCGRGELANRFAAYCLAVIAVNVSQEMPDRRIVKDSVAHHLLDVNADDRAALGKVDDVVVIGSAIHRAQQASLKRIAAENANRDSCGGSTADQGRCEADFMATLSPFLVDGKVAAKLVNWGMVYEPIVS